MLKLNICDSRTPLVILFGHCASGKTMVLYRLTLWLERRGYYVSPVRPFRPAQDQLYSEFCDKFRDWIYGEFDSLRLFPDFTLVEVLDRRGQRVCYIMDTLGDFCFNPLTMNQCNLSTLYQFNNQKVFVFFIEPAWNDIRDRNKYVERIREVKSNFSPKDHCILMYNKVDETHFELSPGVTDMREIYKDARIAYPGLFETFRNPSPFTRLFRSYNCSLIPFSSGQFVRSVDGHDCYLRGRDTYPDNLWKEIKKLLRC